MFIEKLYLWNFRKYGSNDSIDLKVPNLQVSFKKGMNVLIGENDSGKTTIVDAIRYILNTKSFESIRYEEKDFYMDTETNERAENFIIIGIFKGFSEAEASKFLEWGYFNSEKKYELRLVLKANLLINGRITWDIKAGPEGGETQMDGNARELLRVTYLKPLRDAETELTPGYRSRLAQILQSHKSFQKTKDENGKYKKHKLEEIIEEANSRISEFMDTVKVENSDDSKNIIEQINKYVTDFKFKDDKRIASIKVADPELNKILRSLGLEIEENSSGLGTLNKLFMAAELLHLKTDPYDSIKLCIIEELEAHLHPQAQLRVIESLKHITNTQFILTTHSTTLGASINIQNLILCKDGNVFPMWYGETKLAKSDYKFLQRFLNSTKANLFFSKGVIMVEGDAENILVPTIAELIGLPLHQHGVSIVNVGSTAFLRYAKIFLRENGEQLRIPISVITDLDIRAQEFYNDSKNGTEKKAPEFYFIKESKIETNKEELDLESIKDNIYSCFDDLLKEIKLINNIERLPDGVKITIEKWKVSQNIENINSIREKRRKIISRKFDEPVKPFIGEKWTLEYDISLSKKLKIYFAQSVEIAIKIKSSETFFDQLYDKDNNLTLPKSEDNNTDNDVEVLAKSKCESGSELDIAYNIFKPFISTNKPSKAVTAQIFSELLLLNKLETSSIVQKDKYLKYIVNAIKYACGVDFSE